MFNKILIANRGEIACRIIKTAKACGIQTVAVYSDADANSLFVQQADEAYRLGAPPSQDSYLKSDLIIKIAKQTDCQAIHPGFGFLAENAEFANACHDNNIVFIGPSAHAIEQMGSKDTAKKIMQRAGVPVVPGYHGQEQDEKTLLSAIKKIGCPVLVKASSGGGGKGMKVVHQLDDAIDAINSAKREALASFNNDHVILEKYLSHTRHVEVQVFCDSHQNGVYLFERDCSLQRRHQKVIEEAPAPRLSDSLRKKMGETALTAAKAINYQGAGTVELLLNKDESFYFMEMNTRLQVEHPVTEMITHQDLVEWQFKIANGEPLPLAQDQLSIHGHAIEARIYAEDPSNNFLPATGQIKFLSIPYESDTVRIETGIQQGDSITQYYDPMIAKLIAWGGDRTQAIKHLYTALNQFHITGVKTNIKFLKSCLQHTDFIKANLSTHFIEEHNDVLLSEAIIDPILYCFASIYDYLNHQKKSPWDANEGWKMNLPNRREYSFDNHGEAFTLTLIVLNENKYCLQLADGLEFQCQAALTNNTVTLMFNDNTQRAKILDTGEGLFIETHHQSLYIKPFDKLAAYEQLSAQQGHLTAPMPGTVIALCADAGTAVATGERLLILEAMKMEHTIHAPSDGTVKQFYFNVGDQVTEGAELLAFEASE